MRERGAIAGLALAVLVAAAPMLNAQGAAPARADQLGERSNVFSTAPILVESPGAPAGSAVLPVITLDQDMLDLNSKWGQRVQADLERQGREIAAENDRLEKQFADEERELTQLRATLPPEEFRTRADAFDTRVVEVRRERANAARELQSRANEERGAFFRAALPVLAAMMRERGAVAVLDRNSVFVAAESIDVTEALIQRLDASIGTGPTDPVPPPQAPATPQAPALPAPAPEEPEPAAAPEPAPGGN